MKPSTNTPKSPGFYWVRELKDGSDVRVVKIEDRGDGQLAFASQSGATWVPLAFGFDWGKRVECPWEPEPASTEGRSSFCSTLA